MRSVWDNNSGDRTGKPPSLVYFKVFGEVQSLAKKFEKGAGVDMKCVSALWCLQLAHLAVKWKIRKGVLHVDNFYTRHTLGEKLNSIIDEKVRICCTVRVNNVGSTNKLLEEAAIGLLQSADGGEWVLTQAFTKKNHNMRIAKKVGFAVLRDRSTVLFYTNNQVETPAVELSNKRHLQATRGVHGLTKESR